MEDIEQAISGVLSNPQLMQQIMGMAQALGGMTGSPEAPSQEPEQKPQESPRQGPDPSQLAGMAKLLGSANIDSDQQNLLKALSPFVTGPHIAKLQRAMQAARLAELAENLLGSTAVRSGDQNV